MKKTKQLRQLDRQHVGVGTLVMINVPDDHRQAKWNGQKGTIQKLECNYNPIPIVQLHSGKALAVELKHLIYPRQESLFE